MTDDSATRRERLRDEMWRALVPQLLERWYPCVVDEEFGGFYSRLSRDFQVTGEQKKQIVAQTRHLWTASKAAALLSADHRYAPVAEHGFRYLQEVMWDRDHGGFFATVYARSADGVWPGEARGRPRNRMTGNLKRARNRAARSFASLAGHKGEPLPKARLKLAYDHAFAIFALAADYGSSARDQALDLAREAFGWVEEHCHDPEHGGYLSRVGQDGSPLQVDPHGLPPKDHDSILHLIEAFTELYRVWPDDLVRRRLEELIDLVLNRLISQRGILWKTFARDWTPVRLTEAELEQRKFRNDHVSFGHDIEMAALLIEASDVLGPARKSAIHAAAKRMADHSLEHGWDEEHGGLFTMGYYFTPDGDCEIVERGKLYWVQAEALNTLSLMQLLYPDDPKDYAGLFEAQWQYCDTYMIDHAHGGWFWKGTDILPVVDQPGKATPVRATYHVGRALMNAVTRLS